MIFSAAPVAARCLLIVEVAALAVNLFLASGSRRVEDLRRRVGVAIEGAWLVLLGWLGVALVEGDGGLSLSGALLWLTIIVATGLAHRLARRAWRRRQRAPDPPADRDKLLHAADLGLTRDELCFIVEGLGQWGGPARPEPEVAALADFDGVQEMYAAVERLRRSVESGEPLSRRDWRRLLILTELIFASDTFGAGYEWETVTGRDDGADLRFLRRLQSKLVGVCPPD
jgi:hypothetical protein